MLGLYERDYTNMSSVIYKFLLDPYKIKSRVVI